MSFFRLRGNGPVLLGCRCGGPSGWGARLTSAAPQGASRGALFSGGVPSMVLDCLPGVASVCAKLQQALRHSPAESRVPGPTQVANWARVLAIKQDAASV